MMDQGAGMTPYKGITSLAGGSLSACAEAYFAQSEQLPTRFSLSFDRSSEPGVPEHWRAGGIMLQHMPKASPLMVGLRRWPQRTISDPSHATALSSIPRTKTLPYSRRRSVARIAPCTGRTIADSAEPLSGMQSRQTCITGGSTAAYCDRATPIGNC